MRMRKKKHGEERLTRCSEYLYNHEGAPLTSPSETVFGEDRPVYLEIGAGKGGFAFIETPPLAPYKAKIDTLVIYKWNRHYPSDKKLDIAPRDMGMRLVKTYDFVGSSHEKITKEVYER